MCAGLLLTTRRGSAMRYVQCSRCTDSAQLGRLKADIVKSYRNGDLLVVQVNTPAVCLFRLKQYIIVKKKKRKTLSRSYLASD